MAAVSAVVPAAGLSSRMGGPNKLLLPYKDTTVVGAVVRTLLASGLDVVVVTGRDADLVAEQVTPARTAFNVRFADGLGTSIACGVRQVPAGNHVLIALGDMPALKSEVVGTLIARAHPEKIVVPRYADSPDTPGHPVLFGSTYLTALRRLRGDQGAGMVLASNKDKVVKIEIPGSLTDVDTPSGAS